MSKCGPKTGRNARFISVEGLFFESLSSDLTTSRTAAAEPMITERYNAREAEPRWQKVWDERNIFATRNDDLRQKYYVL